MHGTGFNGKGPRVGIILEDNAGRATSADSTKHPYKTIFKAKKSIGLCQKVVIETIKSFGLIDSHNASRYPVSFTVGNVFYYVNEYFLDKPRTSKSFLGPASNSVHYFFQSVIYCTRNNFVDTV